MSILNGNPPSAQPYYHLANGGAIVQIGHGYHSDGECDLGFGTCADWPDAVPS